MPETTYTKIEAEQRKGDNSVFARYNKYKDDKIQKEDFMKKKMNKAKQTLSSTTGKSHDSADWSTRSRDKNGDKDVKTEGTAKYKEYTPTSIFEDFDFVDATKLGGFAGSTAKCMSVALVYVLVILLIWFLVEYYFVFKGGTPLGYTAMKKSVYSMKCKVYSLPKYLPKSVMSVMPSMPSMPSLTPAAPTPVPVVVHSRVRQATELPDYDYDEDVYPGQ